MPLEAKNNKFFLDGKEIRLLSGTMHYFRVVPEYWKDRMLKMKACGLNCLETYVCWNLHEEVKGEFDFEGILNVRKYIQVAKEVGLYVLFRPGPYICAEWDFGGLPSWLLCDPQMKIRSAYKPYLDAVNSFFDKLFPQIQDLQYSNGGPIIAFQLENEYGSYGNDTEYKSFLKKKFEESGLKELYFTSDNGVGIQIGEVPGALITANFQEEEHGYLMKEYLENVKQPGMPFMAMEFWTGWFDHWGEKHHVWAKEKFQKVLSWILNSGGSVNFYMFHGGTNFGFMAGANEGLGATNEGNKQPYQPDITSYDYDAPITEDGRLSEKWYTVRDTIKQLVPGVEFSEAPTTPPARAYGKLEVQEYMAFEDLLQLIQPIKSEKVVPMEMLNINNGGGQGYGLTLYRKHIEYGSKLKFPGKIHDRAIVYVNKVEKEVLDFQSVDHELSIDSGFGDYDLDILVDNMGRVNYADFNSPVMNNQRKGLRDLHIDGKAVQHWSIYPLEFKKDFLEKACKSAHWKTGAPTESNQPFLFKTTLVIENNVSDTFINMNGWTKGFVVVNKFNIGRYWNIGPQKTLYIPGPLLKQGNNEILIFELHKPSDHVTFEATPTLGEIVHHETEITELTLPAAV